MSRGTFWRLMALGYFLVAAAVLVSNFMCLARHPPVPPISQTNCPAHDPGNPWCIK